VFFFYPILYLLVKKDSLARRYDLVPVVPEGKRGTKSWAHELTVEVLTTMGTAPLPHLCCELVIEGRTAT
jgi:hypothetical protein